MRRFQWTAAHLYVSQNMNPETQDLIETIDGIRSAEEPDDLTVLDLAVTKLFQCGNAAAAIPCLFRLLERFPDKDGFGIFWSVLHGLESLPGYETELLESVQRKPSQFSVRMINRIINTGQKHICDNDLLNVLQLVVDNPTALHSVQTEATQFIEYQRKKEG